MTNAETPGRYWVSTMTDEEGDSEFDISSDAMVEEKENVA